MEKTYDIELSESQACELYKILQNALLMGTLENNNYKSMIDLYYKLDPLVGSKQYICISLKET